MSVPSSMSRQAPAADARLCLRVLGGVAASFEGKPLRIASRRARALLGYLALEGAGLEQRSRLGTLLWRDGSESQIRANMRTMLHEARSALRTAAPLLQVEREHVRLDRSDIDLDVTAMLQAAASGTLPDALVTDAKAPASLLADCEDLTPEFDAWLRGIRRRITGEVISHLEKAFADDRLPRRERRRMAEATLALDPMHEAACRWLMRLAVAEGETSVALRAYGELHAVLEHELDSEPSEETQALIAKIKLGQLDAAPRVAATISTSSGAPVVAVLPLRLLGADAGSTFLAEGIVEDITLVLAMQREPIVISSHSTRQIRTEGMDPATIGSRLGADYLVLGSLRQSGRQARVSVELAEARLGSVLWGRVYDVDASDLFETQARIAAGIAHALVPRLQEAELRRARRQIPEALSAYHLMLEARSLLFGRARKGFEEAGHLLQRAIALDPSYAAVHAAMAHWLILRLGQGWSNDPAGDAIQAEAFARDAIALDAANARALALYGHCRTVLAGDTAGALRLFDQALAIAPNDAEALLWSVPSHAFVGDAEGAIKRARNAMLLSPDDPFRCRQEHYLSIALYAAGRFDEAAEAGLRSMARNPDYTSNLRMTAAALAAVGRTEEATRVAGHMLRLDPTFRIGPMIARQAFQDPNQRSRYGTHLRHAGLPA